MNMNIFTLFKNINYLNTILLIYKKLMSICGMHKIHDTIK